MHIPLHSEAIDGIFADNKKIFPKHKAGYNGLASIKPKGCDTNLFVDNYAGLNHEHYFDNHLRPIKEMIHPRQLPMKISKDKSTNKTTDKTTDNPATKPTDKRTEKITDKTTNNPATKPTDNIMGKILLTQDPYLPWEIQYRGEFQLIQDVIQFDLFFTPKKDLQESKFLGIFFASYLNTPKEKGIHVHSEGKWKYFESPKHGSNGSIAHLKNKFRPIFNTDVIQPWLFKSFADFDYDLPIFYGNNKGYSMVYMFHPNSELCFAHSPSGGGEGNPAWDFYLLIPTPEKDVTYSIHGALMIKPIMEDKSIENAYQKWLAQSEKP